MAGAPPRAMDLAALRGAKRLIRLQVSGAFHTPLMQSAADGMAHLLGSVDFQDPLIPVIANCTGRPLKTAEAIKEELVQQISGCVQWQRSVRYMTDAGVTDFYEIGPGRVLTAMVKRITSDVRVTDMSDRSLLAAQATVEM
ncbi:MAG: ACP S-malonyltransferase [Chloroflexi bacterium]|nr:ACP S-malonyltransferase [Chloroflexota bacterium]